MEYILIVTWFLLDQAPTSYQVRFGSSIACAQARTELQNEEKRFKAEAQPEIVDNMEVPGPPAPRLSALCVPVN
ncbi:MAG: hypothetical protein KIS73_25105 [Enhydrobacter sp.]|nr:hypothetical protein [Enhydrobacter sp.]